MGCENKALGIQNHHLWNWKMKNKKFGLLKFKAQHDALTTDLI
jgi:hypothetical protein